MRIGPNEAALLDAFARAASKAQGIEAILQDSVAGIEVVQDTRNRPFPDIEKKIDKLPLGPLLNRFIKTVAKDMNYSDVFERLWYDINQERIFLMHKFFRQFPIAKLEGNEEAARRLERIDELLDGGCRFLTYVFTKTVEGFNVPPTEFRKFLAYVVDQRKKANPPE